MIKYFQNEMPSRFEENQDKIFSAAFDMNLNQKMMKKIEKEYLTMKSKKTEDEMEIKVRDTSIPPTSSIPILNCTLPALLIGKAHDIIFTGNILAVTDGKCFAPTENGQFGTRI